MIPGTAPTLQTEPWRKELAAALRDPGELCRILDLPADVVPGAQAAHCDFGLRVPWPYIARMRKGDPDDPLLLQVMPTRAELVPAEGYSRDPVGDLDAMVVPGVLQKYHGRALLLATGACAVHCRYCFRRHFPYGDASSASNEWREALSCLAADSSIEEVILSGGDPLTLPDSRLEALAHRLGAIPHVKRLRIHTRLPVVLPSRVDARLTSWLAAARMQTIVVLHINHANEIDQHVRESAQQLRAAGATLLNQAVLLRRVNDSVTALVELSDASFAAGVLPYYLHQLDPVRGASHFKVEETAARELLEALRARLPGYLVPRLVTERPGAPAKIPLPG